MRNRLLSIPLALSALTLLMGADCLDTSLKRACSAPSDCNDGYSCVEQVCIKQSSNQPQECDPAAQTPVVATKEQLCTAKSVVWEAPDSIAERNQRVVGQWLQCEGEHTLTSDIDHIGIEYACDGRFYLLEYNGAGAIVRGQGIGKVGQWDFLPETLQLDTIWDGQFGGRADFVAFDPAGDRLAFNLGGGTDYRLFARVK